MDGLMKGSGEHHQSIQPKQTRSLSKISDGDNALQQFVSELLKMKGITLAWAFPKRARSLKPDNNYKDYTFPGIVLLMQKCA